MTAQPQILIKARRSMSLNNGLRDTDEGDQTYNRQNLYHRGIQLPHNLLLGEGFERQAPQQNRRHVPAFR